MDALPLANLAALKARADQFAAELSRTVQSVAGPLVTFKADVDTEGERLEAAIRQAGDGIPLTRDGEVILTLEVAMWLIPDHEFSFLKVRTSRFRVFPADETKPVFRYEFEAEFESGDRLPAAHVQFHGSHPELERAMHNTARGRLRGRQTEPEVSRLHFPVGGSRFRPCLEDVLEMLIHEFEVDPEPNKSAALQALADGRRRWRTMQLRAAIRDDHETAAGYLREMGYAISWQRTDDDPPEPHETRLRQL